MIYDCYLICNNMFKNDFIYKISIYWNNIEQFQKSIKR